MTEQRKCKGCKTTLPLVLFVGEAVLCMNCEHDQRAAEAEARRQARDASRSQAPGQLGIGW